MSLGDYKSMPLMTNPLNESTFERFKRIAVEQLGVEPANVVDTALFDDDLGADSLDAVELLMAVEEEWNIEIRDEDAESVRTVGDAVKLIDQLTQPAPAK